MRVLVCLVTIVALTGGTSAAQAAGDLEREIRARTRVIESAQSTRDEQLDAQAARGVLFRKTGRFDLAIVDLTEVLRSRPQADDVRQLQPGAIVVDPWNVVVDACAASFAERGIALEVYGRGDYPRAANVESRS